MDGLSLRFVDPDLERDYQRVAAAEGRNGLRATLGASVVIWLLAALVLPVATELSAVVAIWVPLAMAALSALTLLASRWAVTLDRQHLLISLLTGANGLVIMALALAAGLMRGYAVGAIMLLFTFGFLARTRFVFASLRTAVIVAGFVVIVATYPDPSDLILDGFILIGGAVGSLLAGRSRAVAVVSGAALMAGSACTRFGIFEAGQQSARDPKYTVVPQRERVDRGEAVRHHP